MNIAKVIDMIATKQLVALHNELTDGSVKRFAARGAGEKRVRAALEKFEGDAAPLLRASLEASKLSPEDIDKLMGAASKPAAPKKPKPAADRSAAIAESWKNPETAAKRATRTQVKVGGTVFRSTRQAFVELNLPLEKHIRFRMELKEKGRAKFGDHTFTTVAKD